EVEYLPQSLETATRMMPDARWVLVSVPGRHAAGVARDALQFGRNVFLYSDNVSIAEEVALKREAGERGLLLLGPDCGTAIINGVGLGFANRVRRGPIGLVAASGTGLQAVTSHIHQLGNGITHAIGTGGRDLSREVGGATTRAALLLLAHDSETRVIVLISKPPAPEVAAEILALAQTLDKPVVVNFVGYPPPAPQLANVHFVTSFSQAASLAARLAEEITRLSPSVSTGASTNGSPTRGAPPTLPSPFFPLPPLSSFAPSQRYLRGLFSGGTLAYEAQLALSRYLPVIYSNVPLEERSRLANPLESAEHTIIDLGADEFTVGRLHPMLDSSLRLRRLQQEAADPQVAVILLDVVLGDGAHPEPAGELAPAIAEAKGLVEKAGRHLEVAAIVIGTDEDPQGLERQLSRLESAGAYVATTVDAAAEYVGNLLRSLGAPAPTPGSAVASSVLIEPVQAINVG
ncbi:MAG: protein FdrA, partial [Ardenticatenaceae bacterium]